MSDAGLTQAGQGHLFAKFLRFVRARVRFGLRIRAAINTADLSAAELRDIGLTEGRLTEGQMREASDESLSRLLQQASHRW
ncbi:hypothetical protein [Oryzibacter oryziterrae]|uniref:hypothetical protein n=1 Tax=Oryzibacter oryziterrae TaxID=2766474 RepID=UPI001F3B1A1F|nr:hypothetical protein [Oryzibacter oryziterrae]